MELHDFQVNAVDQVQEAFKSHKGVFLCAPTGSGKTVMASEYINRFLAEKPHAKILFLAHRTDLLKQTSDKLKQWELDHGVQYSTTDTNPSSNVQVASIQTIISRQEVPFEPDLIVADEAHTCASDTYLALFKYFKDVPRLLLSATPIRYDGKGFEDIVSELIIAATTAELVDSKHIVEVLAVHQQGTMLSTIVEVFQKECKGEKTLIFADNKLEASRILNQFRANNIEARFIHAQTPDNERDEAIEQFKNGNLRVLINVNILSEGFDFPQLSRVIITHSIKSKARYLQILGRVSRTAPDKKYGFVHDYQNNRSKHGDAIDDHQWSLKPSKPPLHLADVMRRHEEIEPSELKAISDEYWQAYSGYSQKSVSAHGKKNTFASHMSALGTLKHKHSILDICAALWNTNKSKFPDPPPPIKAEYELVYPEGQEPNKDEIKSIEFKVKASNSNESKVANSGAKLISFRPERFRNIIGHAKFEFEGYPAITGDIPVRNRNGELFITLNMYGTDSARLERLAITALKESGLVNEPLIA